MPTQEDTSYNCFISRKKKGRSRILNGTDTDMKTFKHLTEERLLEGQALSGDTCQSRLSPVTAMGSQARSGLQFELTPLLQVSHLLEDQRHAVPQLLELGRGDLKAVCRAV